MVADTLNRVRLMVVAVVIVTIANMPIVILIEKSKTAIDCLGRSSRVDARPLMDTRTLLCLCAKKSGGPEIVVSRWYERSYVDKNFQLNYKIAWIAIDKLDDLVYNSSMKSKENNMNNSANKAFVFDFDDTLATTDCKVYLRNKNSDEIVKLTPAEYNEADASGDYYFDYSEFYGLIEPQETWLFPLVKEVYNENHAVYILTARGSIAGEAIAQFLAERGIVAKAIYCVGDNAGKIEEEKRKVLLTIIEAYDKIYFYDDHKGNIDQAPESNKLRKYLVWHIKFWKWFLNGLLVELRTWNTAKNTKRLWGNWLLLSNV